MVPALVSSSGNAKWLKNFRPHLCGTGVAEQRRMESIEPTGPERSRMGFAPAGGLLVVLLVLSGTGTARGAWDEISRVLGLQGKPAPASANVLSEHHLESLDSMAPQAQAEFLLERSMNHYEGANREIERRLGGWRGRLDKSDRLESLFRLAINSDDLRVRVAAVEIDIVVRGLDKRP